METTASLSYEQGSILAPGLPARIAERWRLWRQRRRWIAEMQHAAALGRLDELLQDVGMTRAELDLLVESPLDAGQQFEVLAAAEHVDVAALPPDEVREAHWACVRCECREPCKEWLRDGTWRYEGDPRCPNAELLHRD